MSDPATFSNGTEFQLWSNTWCETCTRDAAYRSGEAFTGCDIIVRGFLGDHTPEWRRGPIRSPQTVVYCTSYDPLPPVEVVDTRSEAELLEALKAVSVVRHPEPDDSEEPPTNHPFVVCPECREELDVPVNLTVTTDKDSGAQFIEAEPDLTDVWAHAWTHEEKP